MKESLGMLLVVIGTCLFTNDHEFWGAIVFILGLLCWSGKPSVDSYLAIMGPLMLISILGVYVIDGGSWLWHHVVRWLQ